MRKRGNQNKEAVSAINRMDKNIETIAKNSVQTNQNVNDIKRNTETLIRNSNSRSAAAMAVIGTAAAVIGTIATVIGLIISIKDSPAGGDPTSPAAATLSPAAPYEIYLYPEYKRLKVYAETDITATANFDTASVIINAYLDSEKNGDTVEMTQKNTNEWQSKIYFEETGIFEVVATATAPDGSVIENSVEIEVISSDSN